MRSSLRLMMAIGGLFLCSCAGNNNGRAPTTRESDLDYPLNAPIPHYDIEAINHQRQTLHNVDVRFGYPEPKGNNPEPIFGILSPGASAGYGFIPIPIPDRVRVSWDGDDGRHYEKEVDVLRASKNGSCLA